MTKSSRGESPDEQLRELIREAHGACRDLNVVLRECRELKAQLVKEVHETAAEAANIALARIFREFQDNANAQSAELNRYVREAQKHIVSSLTEFVIRRDEKTGNVVFKFTGAMFDENAKVIVKSKQLLKRETPNLSRGGEVGGFSIYCHS